MKRHRIVATEDAQEGMRSYADVDALSLVDDSVTDEQLAAERALAMVRIEHVFRHGGPGTANRLLRQVVGVVALAARGAGYRLRRLGRGRQCPAGLNRPAGPVS